MTEQTQQQTQQHSEVPLNITRVHPFRYVIYVHQACGALDAFKIFVGEQFPQFVNCWQCAEGRNVAPEKMSADQIGMRAVQIDNEDGTVFATISKEAIVREKQQAEKSNALDRVHAQGAGVKTATVIEMSKGRGAR
jgi:hypothetical protein